MGLDFVTFEEENIDTPSFTHLLFRSIKKLAIHVGAQIPCVAVIFHQIENMLLKKNQETREKITSHKGAGRD